MHANRLLVNSALLRMLLAVLMLSKSKVKG